MSKICPICNTPNPNNASLCATCGTSLEGVTARTSQAPYNQSYADDFRYGETDLLETAVARSPRSLALVISSTALLTALLVGGGMLMLFNAQNNNAGSPPLIQATVSPSPSLTLGLATVTLGPPTHTVTFTPSPSYTPSDTPEPSPCVQVIQPGGSLIGAIINCGHRSQDVLPTVLALNNIADAAAVQVNQQVIIPWPTATIDPNSTPTPTPTGASVSDASLLEVNSQIDAFAPTETPTLPPGVMWYEIRTGDDITTIALEFNANAKVLSELNPEIDFARCEFGERFGGPECIVSLFAGQLMRVPAPTATPTFTPSPDPNATATPTATATVNYPSVISPLDKQFFAQTDLVTLRWVPSAALAAGQAYRVDVRDETSGTSYIAITQDISFVVPIEWQGQDALRHDYVWQVGIIEQQNPEAIAYQTEPVRFIWQGKQLGP